VEGIPSNVLECPTGDLAAILATGMVVSQDSLERDRSVFDTRHCPPRFLESREMNDDGEGNEQGLVEKSGS